MPPAKTVFTTEVNGLKRVLFSVQEKRSGDLIVPIAFAGNLGFEPDGPRILEQRYSIHTSQNSLEFTTIKHTIRLSDGRVLSSAALTDGIKQKTGYALLFVRRCPDLSDEQYLLNGRDKRRATIVEAVAFDPRRDTLFTALLVGHPDLEFGVTNDVGTVATEVRFDCFRLILLSYLFGLPSHHTGEFIHSVTLPPKVAGDDAAAEERLRSLMRGKDKAWCIERFHTIAKLISVSFMQRRLREQKDPKWIKFYQDAIRELSIGITVL